MAVGNYLFKFQSSGGNEVKSTLDGIGKSGDSAFKTIEQGSASALKYAKMAAAGISAYATVDYISNQVSAALAYSDAISDTAKANDLAVSSVIGLSSALNLSGGSADNAGKFIQNFTNQLDDAARGSKDARDGLSRIGISLKDIASKSTQELITQGLSGLSKIEDAATRNSLAQANFGRAAKGVDFRELGETYASASEEMKGYAHAVETAADLHDKLDEKSTKTMVMFTNAFIPTLNVIYDDLTKNKGALETFFGYASESFQGLTIAAKFATDGVFAFIETVKTGGLQLNSLLKGDVDAVKKYGSEYVSYMNTQYADRQKFYESLKKLNEKGDGDSPPKSPGRTIGVDDKEIEKYAKGLGRAQDANDKFIASMRAMAQKDQLNIDAAFMSETDKKLAQDMITINKAFLDTQAEVTKQYTEGKLQLSAYNEQAAILSGNYQFAAEQAQKLKEKQDALNQSWAYGASRALNSYANEASNMAKNVEGSFTRIAKGMEDSLVSFVMTAKLNFSNLANSMIADMIRIAIQQSITAPLAKAGASFFSGIFGNISTANKYGTNVGSQQTSMLAAQDASLFQANGGAWDSGIQKFAKGGAFTNTIVDNPTLFKFAKGTGLMGEAGPEAIMPLSRDSSGRLGVAVNGGGGGGSPVINMNIINQGAADGYQASATARKNDRGFDIEIMIQKAVNSDIARNGPISQNFAGAFGLRRGAA